HCRHACASGDRGEEGQALRRKGRTKEGPSQPPAEPAGQAAIYRGRYCTTHAACTAGQRQRAGCRYRYHRCPREGSSRSQEEQEGGPGMTAYNKPRRSTVEAAFEMMRIHHPRIPEVHDKLDEAREFGRLVPNRPKRYI